MRAVSILSAAILTLGLIIATPDLSATRSADHAVRVVAVALVTFADQPTSTHQQRAASVPTPNDVSDFLNSLPSPIPELYHSVLAIGLFFVFLPAFWVVVNVVSAANVVLHAFGLPLLPNVFDPPFGPGPRTTTKAAPTSTATWKSRSSGVPKPTKPGSVPVLNRSNRSSGSNIQAPAHRRTPPTVKTLKTADASKHSRAHARPR